MRPGVLRREEARIAINGVLSRKTICELYGPRRKKLKIEYFKIKKTKVGLKRGDDYVMRAGHQRESSR